LIAEEIEPQTLLETGGEDVEDRAAYRELARVDDRVGAGIALSLQQRGQTLVADANGGLQYAHGFADANRNELAREGGVVRRDEDLAAADDVLMFMQRRQAPGADRSSGTRPIVREAVPGRKFDDVQL